MKKRDLEKEYKAVTDHERTSGIVRIIIGAIGSIASIAAVILSRADVSKWVISAVIFALFIVTGIIKFIDNKE